MVVKPVALFLRLPGAATGLAYGSKYVRKYPSYMKNSCYVIGNGAAARFWLDKWCSPRPLKLEAPNLFRIVRRKQSLVGEIVKTVNGIIDIKMLFYEPVEYWFMHEVVLVHNYVYGSPLNHSTVDTLVWSGNEDESVGFSVSEAYRILSGPLAEVFPTQAIWSKRVPLKVQFFVWTAALGKIPTIDFMIR